MDVANGWKRRMRGGWAALTVALLAIAAAGQPAPAQRGAGRLTVAQVAPGYYLVSRPDANLLLYAGAGGTIVTGVQAPDLVQRARRLLDSLHAQPVRYALALDSDSAALYADGGWGRTGAVTMAQELLYGRMKRWRNAQPATAAQATDLPAVGFSQVVQVHLAPEEVHFVHERSGYTNADMVVHFEREGLLYLGNTFTNDGYPVVDSAGGGSLAGMIATADFFLTAFVGHDANLEPIIPGRGPVATVADLRAYREMLVGVRDRVQALVRSGASLPDVVTARPTAPYDARWGHSLVSPAEFVAAVYRSERAAAPSTP
jgi:cyclase